MLLRDIHISFALLYDPSHIKKGEFYLSYLQNLLKIMEQMAEKMVKIIS